MQSLPIPLLVRCAAAVLLLVLGVNDRILAGPQHWGSGYPYLAVIERDGKNARLAVYEPPMRAKTAQWLCRWTDAHPRYQTVLPGAMVIGDFWPADTGREYLCIAQKAKHGNELTLLQAPERFSTAPWTVVGSSSASIPNLKWLAAGDLLGKGRDQLVAIILLGKGRYEAVLIEPAIGPRAAQWPIGRRLLLPSVAGELLGASAGDFWGRGADGLALVSRRSARDDAQIRYYTLTPGGWKLDAVGKAERAGQLVTGNDFVKDGFDVVTMLDRRSGALELRTAPTRNNADEPKPEGPAYTGRALSRQMLPGTDRHVAAVTMYGRLESFGKARPAISAVASGRVFGYVRGSTARDVMERNGYDPRPDAEIAFTARFPRPNLTTGAPHFGWPAKGETFGFVLHLKNNGGVPLRGPMTLRVWMNTPYRNADTRPDTASRPTHVIRLDSDMVPFDPMKPQYRKITIAGKWPYSLVPCGPVATWKKIDLEKVGERWIVVALDAPGDRTFRNNRYEVAFHSHTYHPVFREFATLGLRKPTVAGDPCSIEYLARKMADAINVVWERSGTTTNQDVLQRTYMDGYEIGGWAVQPDEQSRMRELRRIQSQWEGWRELDIWWGENQAWEKYDWQYYPELHESGHLFHPLGDLYGNYLMPVWTGAARMADETPVQLRTNLWGPDLFGSGHALIGPPACEVMRRYIVGARGVGVERWWTVTPHRMVVRVLDRTGKPVPNADVSLWAYGNSKPFGSGRTDAKGRWDVTPFFGQLSPPDNLGIRHYNPEQNNDLTNANGHIFTLKVGDYQDFAVWDTTDVSSHSRHTLLYRAMTHEKGWVWDWRTNYSPEAAAPSFTVEASVMDRQALIRVRGDAPRYRLYRRWEPTYARKFLGEYAAAKGELRIFQQMGERDGYTANRFRAVYEVTAVRDGAESLPRAIQLCGLTNAYGIAALADGKLLVTTNSGIANPFAALFDGTTPTQELFYHYRFGHTAMKAVQSRVTPGKYFITLLRSDTRPEYRFDIAVPPREGWYGYDVRTDLHEFSGAVSADSPQSVELHEVSRDGPLNPGDEIESPDGEVKVIAVDGNRVELERPAFKPGSEVRFNASRLAGRPGSRAEFRELMDPRGLATVVHEGEEYIAIADTGNRRIVVWDSNTKFIAAYESGEDAPAALAADPTDTTSVFALYRGTDSISHIERLRFDGERIERTPFDLGEIAVGDHANLREMGLAVALDPKTDKLWFAVTDGGRNRILEFVHGTGTASMSVHTRAIGAYAGKAELVLPTDAAYVVRNGQLELYAVDGADRVVRVR